MKPDLDAYFDRIAYTGPRTPDLATLTALSKAHLFAIAFENLDVQLERAVSLEIENVFDKLVARRRGGWCYEQNGLLGWALGELGFDVTRMAGGVNRIVAGDEMLGNHLCLKVALDRDYLVDVGFGGSLIGPIPISEGVLDQAPFSLSLQQTDGGFWRFSEDAGDGPFGFDFRAEPADEKLLAGKCAWLQSHDASPFVLNLAVQRRAKERHSVLRGRVLTVRDPGGKRDTLIGDADELLNVLRDVFDLDEPAAARLWPKICARHETVMAERAAAGR